MRHLDLNLLLVFEALYAERSVTRAARRLGVTQPALSNALRRLRTMFDDPLFVRARDGIAPTPRALALGPRVSAALVNVRDAIDETGFDPQRSAGRFTVGTLDYLEALQLPGVVNRLAKAGPAITLNVRRLASIFEVPQQALEAGAIDCALGLFPLPLAPQTGLHAAVLREEAWVCVGRRAHPDFSTPLSLERYLGLTHVAVSYPENDRAGLIDRQLAALGFRRNCVAVLPHFMTLPFHAATSDCVATLPRSVAAAFASPLGLEVSELPFELPRVSISIAWHERLDRDPAHAWFRTLLIGALGADR